MTTPLGEALASEREHRPVDKSWWLEAQALRRAIEEQGSALQASACYQLADAVLQVSADNPALLDAFGQLYGDCAVPAPVVPEEALVRCTVRRGIHPPLLLLTFQAGAPPDPAAVAVSLLRATPVAPPYTVCDSALTGWRLAGGVAQPVLAACDTYVLIDPQQVPPDFLVEYLVSTTLAAQPEVLVVHAASLRIGNAGVLLSGPSHGGKTTMSLHLAARGHTLLGDEMAVLRLANHEVVPLRRSLSLRSGPRASELSAALGRLAVKEGAAADGKTGPFRVHELFPGSSARPVPLQAVFFLSGFADHPSLAPFRLTLHDVDLFDWLANNDIAHTSWGLAPERRALRLLALKHMLARLPCWRLKVGAPLETAELIERTMEGLGC